MNHMLPNGQLPLRVGAYYFLLKFFGFNTKVKPRYIEDKGVSVAVDSNSLFLIVFYQYYQATKDLTFLNQNIDKLKSIIDWNFSQTDDRLFINEGVYGGWADSLRKKGAVLYSNTLHYLATLVFSMLSDQVNSSDISSEYQKKAELIKSNINKYFWNGDYYSDWIDGDFEQMVFSTDGNVFASIFNIASDEQSKKIQKYMETNGLNNDYCSMTNFPKYTWNHIYPWFNFINMRDYHNGLRWLWVCCVDIVFKYQAGFKDESYDTLEKLSQKIVEFGGVYEVYEKGAPVKRLFYKSERNFSWSSGLYIWACKEVGVDITKCYNSNKKEVG